MSWARTQQQGVAQSAGAAAAQLVLRARRLRHAQQVQSRLVCACYLAEAVLVLGWVGLHVLWAQAVPISKRSEQLQEPVLQFW